MRHSAAVGCRPNMNTVPKTPAERQRKHKNKLAASGVKEVRGILAHVDDHQEIRAPAKKLAEKLHRRRNKLWAKRAP